MDDSTRLFDENIPNAGATPFLIRHSLHLIRRRRRSKDESLRKAVSAKPAGVEMDGLRLHCGAGGGRTQHAEYHRY